MLVCSVCNKEVDYVTYGQALKDPSWDNEQVCEPCLKRYGAPSRLAGIADAIRKFSRERRK